MSSLKILKSFRIPTDAHSPSFLPSAQSRVPYSGKEVEVCGSHSPSVPAPSAELLLRSPVNPKPCDTFSWPISKSPFTPFLPGKVLLPKPPNKREHLKAA